MLRLLLAAAFGLLTVSGAAAQTVTIGPGTPCTVTWTNPTTNTDGTPLTLPLLKMSWYLDPPASGPVIGTTVPTFSVPLTTAQSVAGATVTVSICKNVPTPIASGPHTDSVTITDAGGESAGGAPGPFSFAGKPSAPVTGVSHQ